MPFPPSQRLLPHVDFPWPPVLTTPPVSALPVSALPEAAVWVYPARTSAADPTSAAHTRPRPVVLVHGFRGDHHGLALIAHDLRDRDVWVPDLPGFGAVPPPEGGLDLKVFTTYIRAVCASCEATTGQRPLLVGHSFGSVLAAHTFAQTPEISPGLGLLSPIVQPPLEGSARLLTQLTRLYYAAGAALPEKPATALLAHPVIVRAMSEVMATSSDRITRRFIHDQHARYFSGYADRSSLARAYRVSITHTVAEAAVGLAESRRPLLVVAGDDDLIAPHDAAQSFVRSLRRAGASVEDHTLNGVGHLLHYERPAAVAQAIEGFARRMDDSDDDSVTP